MANEAHLYGSRSLAAVSPQRVSVCGALAHTQGRAASPHRGRAMVLALQPVLPLLQ